MIQALNMTFDLFCSAVSAHSSVKVDLVCISEASELVFERLVFVYFPFVFPEIVEQDGYIRYYGGHK